MLCAANEMGVKSFPSLRGGERGGALAADPASETWIYRITSGATTGPGAGQRSRNGLAAEGYSLPHNLVFAARLLGLEGVFYCGRAWLGRLIVHRYPGAVSMAKGSGVSVRYDRAPPPANGQRVLRVVVSGGGLHWLLERPDGSVMDPGPGRDYPSLAGTLRANRYRDTGLCLLLEGSKPAGPVQMAAEPLSLASVER
ncbi:hypothetical protein GCM10011289_25240 [Paludibacterium paludis]|uniref:Uncharacterized protein n=1 Tax=Paludibacterium paludis TaxID=1225769 RepID=A0A918P596_9NEIS|nr:hypothetical protein GCM10011289_25240 [Paludibacterium paludis]